MKVGKTGGNVAAAISYYPRCSYYFAFASDGLVVIVVLTGGNRKDGSAWRCETVGKLHRRPFGEIWMAKIKVWRAPVCCCCSSVLTCSHNLLFEGKCEVMQGKNLSKIMCSNSFLFCFVFLERSGVKRCGGRNEFSVSDAEAIFAAVEQVPGPGARTDLHLCRIKTSNLSFLFSSLLFLLEISAEDAHEDQSL